MRFLHGAALTMTLLLVAAASPAQSLGDAAAKEKARRKTVAKPTKVITDDDLRTGGGVVSNPGTETAAEGTTPGTPAAGGAAAPAKKEKSADEVKAEAQAAWQKQVDVTNKQVAQYQADASQIQLALNDTSGGVYTARRATLQTQLDDTNKRLAEAQAEAGEPHRRRPPQRLPLGPPAVPARSTPKEQGAVGVQLHAPGPRDRVEGEAAPARGRVTVRVSRPDSVTRVTPRGTGPGRSHGLDAHDRPAIRKVLAPRASA